MTSILKATTQHPLALTDRRTDRRDGIVSPRFHRSTHAAKSALLLLAPVFFLAGCATHGQHYDGAANKAQRVAAPKEYTRPCVDKPASDAQAFDCDRRSILAMAGEYRVRFEFDETLPLKPGYTTHAPQRSGGTELVIPIEDRGDFIALQHILVVGKDHEVVKHWRQDWQHQPAEVLTFRGNRHFVNVPVDANAAKGAWTQTVYEVDDAPRYAGVGRWTHEYGVDAWTSDFIWRPLPRREYSTRGDYQVLGAINRHTLTPGGWMHEQDNLKLVLKNDGSAEALVREIGVNKYEHTKETDFSAGHDYWKKTETFWRDVRAAWAAAIKARPDFTLTAMVGERPRFESLFALAERADKGEAIARAEIDAIVAGFVVAATSGK